MTKEGLVRAIFELPISDCKKSEHIVSDSRVELLKIGKALQKLFPHKLYQYQLQGIETILNGKDAFLAVGTNSGKTETFLFPLLEEIVAEKNNCVICIYPTKQLAEDQEQRLANYCNYIRETTGKVVTYSRYNGDLSEKDIVYIEKSKPNILLATLDKLFYRCFKKEEPSFLDWIKKAGAIIFDEIHAGSGSYLAHVREFIASFKKINPKVKIVLASATVKEVEQFRDGFLPTATIIKGKSRRGIVRVMILQKESLEQLIIKKIDPYLRKVKGACLVFVDNVAKVSQLVAKCNQVLAEMTGVSFEVLKHNSPFVCINSQLREEEKTEIIRRIRAGSIRFLFTTSLLELGMDIPNIEHIINVGWPITGKNGLLQRLGRLRFRKDLSKKKNFTIVLDPENDYDNYYLKYPNKLKEILAEGLTERVLFNSKNLQQAKAFILFRVVMGITLIKEIFALCPDEEAERTVRTALSLLFAAGLLRTKYHKKPFHERELVFANEQKVWAFIRRHKIRAIDNKWDIVTSSMDGKEQLIGTIDEWRIIRSALPGNVLSLGSKGEFYRVVNLSEQKVRVELLSIPIAKIQKNKLKPPIFLIEPHTRVQQLGKQRVLFGKLIIRRETTTIARYDRTGKLIEQELAINPSNERMQKGNKQPLGEVFEPITNYTWDQKTSGLLFSFDFPVGKLANEEKASLLELFKNLILKATEFALHLSESSFSYLINYHEKQIVLFDRGGSMGNSELLFSKIQKVLKQMLQLVVEQKQGDNSTRVALTPLLNELPAQIIQTTQQLLQEMID